MEQVEGLLTVARGDDLVAMAGERVVQQLTGDLVVVDDQDFHAGVLNGWLGSGLRGFVATHECNVRIAGAGGQLSAASMAARRAAASSRGGLRA